MIFNVHHGDCLEVMRAMEAESFDSICTDPPYGIRFMGLAWDGKDIEERTAERRAQGLDLPKCGTADTGGFRSVAAEAGAYDLSPKGMRAFQEFSRAWAAEALRLLKPGGHLVSFSSARTYHRMVVGIEDAGFEIRDQLLWLYGSGMPKSRNIAKALAKKGDKAAAALLDGWGTGLKPAHEPIVLARKPFRGPVEANMALHGVGGLNIEACRIETDENLNGGAYSEGGRGSVSPALHQLGGMNKVGATAGEYVQPVGRWPANVLHDGSDEVVAMFPEAPGQKGDIKYDDTMRTGGAVYNPMARGHEPSAQKRYDKEGVTDFAALPGMRRFDKGSAARFFYSPKTSSEDRHEGLEHPGPQFRQGSTLRDAERLIKAQARKGNHHPTVKPTELMRWLVRLVTPPGGRTLDPFVGSGSTGKAAVLEGFDFDGIEVDEEHVATAQARIRFARAQGHQPSLLE